MKPTSVLSACLALFVAGLPEIAHAYVGPGAGLSLVAAFWAILVAIGTIVAFTLMWPIRRLMRRRGAVKPAIHDERANDLSHGRGAHGS